MQIIAQSRFDVNEENVEGIVLVGSSTESGMVFSRAMSGLVSASEDDVLTETFQRSNWFDTRQSCMTDMTCVSIFSTDSFWVSAGENL